jgi:general secretion pathway protein M
MNAAALRAWFEGLAPRERLLISAAALLAAAAVAYAGIVEPIIGARARATEALDRNRQLLVDIEGVARRGGPQRSQPASAATSADSLVVVVDRTTRDLGLGAFLKRNQPEGPTAIRLRFENAPFDQLLEWLAAAEARDGLRPTAASFDPSGEPGRVNSNIVLARAGS